MIVNTHTIFLAFILENVPFWQVILYLEKGSILADNIVSRECSILAGILYLQKVSNLAGYIVSRECSNSAGIIVSRKGFHFGR